MSGEFDIQPRNALEREMLALLNKPAKPSPYNYYSSHSISQGHSSVLSDYERRSEFTHKYSWSIPTEEALATIAKYSPIIEIGAGTGLWAAMLRARGVDILAYDAHPPYPDSEENRWHIKMRTFTNVDVGGPSPTDRSCCRGLRTTSPWPRTAWRTTQVHT